MSDLGAFLVVWQRYDGGSATSVRAHAFSNSGAGTGIELLIGNGTLDLFPRIDMDAGGNFVVAWKSIDSTYARLFNADQTAKGAAFLVHTGDFFAQPQVVIPANVAMNLAGGFAIVWEAYSSSAHQFQTYGQQFLNTGVTNGSRLVLTPTGTIPDVAIDARGDIVAAWKASSRIYGQIFAQPVNALLAISVASRNVLIAWPSSAAGYRLEASANLSPNNWLSVTNLPSLNGDRYEVLLPTTNANQFFRLVNP